jgi:acyl carrier protein
MLGMVLDRLRKIISEQMGVDPEEITMETTFKEDLDVDSLDLVDLIMAIEEEFGLEEIDDETAAKLQTVGDLVNLIGEDA